MSTASIIAKSAISAVAYLISVVWLFAVLWQITQDQNQPEEQEKFTFSVICIVMWVLKLLSIFVTLGNLIFVLKMVIEMKRGTTI